MGLADTHLTAVGDALGVRTCYILDGGFHFMVSGSSSVALRGESGDRIRVVLYDGVTRDEETIGWSFASQLDRLRSLALEAMAQGVRHRTAASR